MGCLIPFCNIVHVTENLMCLSIHDQIVYFSRAQSWRLSAMVIGGRHVLFSLKSIV